MPDHEYLDQLISQHIELCEQLATQLEEFMRKQIPQTFVWRQANCTHQQMAKEIGALQKIKQATMEEI